MNDILEKATKYYQSGDVEKAYSLLNLAGDDTPQCLRLKEVCRKTLSEQYIYLMKEAARNHQTAELQQYVDKYKQNIGCDDVVTSFESGLHPQEKIDNKTPFAKIDFRNPKQLLQNILDWMVSIPIRKTIWFLVFSLVVQFVLYAGMSMYQTTTPYRDIPFGILFVAVIAGGIASFSTQQLIMAILAFMTQKIIPNVYLKKVRIALYVGIVVATIAPILSMVGSLVDGVYTYAMPNMPEPCLWTNISLAITIYVEYIIACIAFWFMFKYGNPYYRSIIMAGILLLAVPILSVLFIPMSKAVPAIFTLYGALIIATPIIFLIKLYKTEFK